MPQALVRIYLHIMFATKDRLPFLRDKRLRLGCHAQLAEVCRGYDCEALAIGGGEDHVHLLCSWSRLQTVSLVIREMKHGSSKWLKTKAPEPRDFYWQNGYGVFSVSPAQVDVHKKHIADQEAHHRKESLADELHRFLKEYGVPYDEKQLWD